MKTDPGAGLSLAERRERARSANEAPLSREEVAALAPYPELQPLLACNPNLDVPSRAQLVSALLHRGARDEACYESLGLLAAAGRLTPFDWALRELVSRIEPGRSRMATLARSYAPGVLLQCPDLSEAMLDELDARLAAAKLDCWRPDVAERATAEWRRSAEEALGAALSPPRVTELVGLPAMRRFLVSNRNLAAPAYATLEAELLRQSWRYPDRQCYECLGILACQSRLTATAMQDLLNRITRATSWTQSMNPNPVLAIDVMLRCPDLTPEWLVGLDRRMVDTGRTYRRPRLVHHPAADAGVWVAMLRHRPSPQVVHLIWEMPEATAHPHVQELLAEYRRQATGGPGED